MFLVRDEVPGCVYLVFTQTDPREDGYAGEVEEGVTLDDAADYSWPEGSERPMHLVGRDPARPNHYRVFKFHHELEAAGYEQVAGTAITPGRWSSYASAAGKGG